METKSVFEQMVDRAMLLAIHQGCRAEAVPMKDGTQAVVVILIPDEEVTEFTEHLRYGSVGH